MSLEFEMCDEFTVAIPAIQRPTISDIRKDFEFIESIERDTSLTEASNLTCIKVIRPDENNVRKSEYERRVAPWAILGPGYQQAKWLVEHQDELPNFRAMVGRIYIAFPGMVASYGKGQRFYPLLISDEFRRWYLFWQWIFTGCHRLGRIAVSSKQFS